ncbi:host specificity factor TipJ family phage tail protein [Cycloclasticus pugetii]|uniref:host specificity factor TipJ family phage tail protein n=1 Tax=Cycloclasticus pugetii TaxID=34068 RepID=UPI003A8FDBC8
MTIKVYESILPAEPSEVYDDHGMTVEAWIQSKSADYKRGDHQPVSCAINGEIVKPAEWTERVIGADDVVEFRVVPFGGGGIFGDILSVALPFWGGSIAAGNAAVNALIDIPDINQGGQGSQGARISAADAKANVARLGQGIPEGFGRYIRYPDYLNQPRRYYKDARTQCLDLMLSVGVGEYSIDSQTLKIGETQFSELAGSVSYQIFQPGESVSGNQCHMNWYNAPEVGATTGSSGIRLYRGETDQSGVINSSAEWSGKTIDSTSTNQFPSDWAVGDFLSVAFANSVDVTLNASNEAVLSLTSGGNWGFSAGDLFKIRVPSYTAIEGIYTVETATATEITLSRNGVVEKDWATGSYEMFTSNPAFTYKITNITYVSGNDIDTITVDRYENGVLVSGWTGWGSFIQRADILLAERSENEGWAGPFPACPSGETISTIEVDFFLPQGQGNIDEDKVIPFNTKRQVEVQWRPVGGSTWSSRIYTINNATRDQLGFTYRIGLGGSMRVEVRVRRVQAESNELADLDRIEWIGLRSALPTRSAYPGVTTLAVTIEGTDAIASNSDNQINLVATRKLPTISNGAFTAPSATRQISAAAAYVAKSLGYEDDQIDLAELEQLESIWTPRADFFDYVISDGTAKDAIETILRAGMASMTIDTGAIKPVRDQVRTQFEDGYSPENMTAPLTRTFEARQVDESDGVEVEYTDSETWTTETVLCTLPGDQQIKLDKVKLNGVTDRTRAWRIGMRRRRAQKYRRWTYSFNTELDALNSEYLSYVPLLDDVPGYGKVAILEGIEADRITVSEPMEFEPGKNHVVAYRAENGETIGPFPCTQGPDEYTLLAEIPQPWPAVLPADREPAHVYFGTTERWSFPALITDISPQGPTSVGVEAVNYDLRVYADDDNSPA